jgi:hypothetical protein
MWQVPILIWSLVTLVYSVEYDIITGPMQLFYDTLTIAEGATAQMEYASHCIRPLTRPSFNNMHSNDFCFGTEWLAEKTCRSCGSSNPLQAQQCNNTFMQCCQFWFSASLYTLLSSKSHRCNLEVADNLAMVGWGSMVLSIQHESSIHIPHIQYSQIFVVLGSDHEFA